MRRILLICLAVILFGCSNKSEEVLGKIFQNYKEFDYEYEYFTSKDYLTPHLILYRGKMEASTYRKLIEDSNYIPNCSNFQGFSYENMKENSFPFDLSKIEWWNSVYDVKPDFVGHYSLKMDKFTDCDLSREYKFAYKYLNGYCYLIIENTLQYRQ